MSVLQKIAADLQFWYENLTKKEEIKIRFA